MSKTNKDLCEKPLNSKKKTINNLYFQICLQKNKKMYTYKINVFCLDTKAK